MRKPIQQLPKWAKVLIRVFLFPIALTLHLVPHIIEIILAMKNWIIYGGELFIYQKEDPATIADIYGHLKQQNKQQ